jgi:hypothetical protein
MAAAVPQHLHGLLDPAPPGRLPLGLGHPPGVLALTGARGRPKAAGTSSGTSKNTPPSSAASTVSKRWVAMGRC